MHETITRPEVGNACDPVRLHAQILNNLSRCKAMLLADEPKYSFALGNLDDAKVALAELARLDGGALNMGAAA